MEVGDQSDPQIPARGRRRSAPKDGRGGKVVQQIADLQNSVETEASAMNPKGQGGNKRPFSFKEVMGKVRYSPIIMVIGCFVLAWW